MKHNNLLMEFNMKTSMPTFVRNLCQLTTVFVCIALSSAVYAASKQMSFSSPEEAVKVLLTSVKDDDTKKIIQILGPDAKSLVASGDAVEDKGNRERFLKSYEEANRLEKSNDAKMMLMVGKDEWPFPIPLVKEVNGWRFDTQAGKEEILNRRIGRNELSAIQAVLVYVVAQREYYLANPQQEKLLSYAQKFLSAPNKRDGLYYSVKEGESPSPLGVFYAKAQAAGYTENNESATPQPYYGYFYRILKSQGPDAPGGAYDYVAHGKMLGGYALIAWPATYGNSGVMTFIVNHAGVVYEKDLGPETAKDVKKITTFNPDKTWKPVSEH